MMKKRLFPALLAVILTLALLPGTSRAAAPQTLPYEIDTVASGLYRFHALVLDSSGRLYYADGDTVCLAGAGSLDLTVDFDRELYDPYLSYDPYSGTVYLLANDAETNGLRIYDITGLDAPRLVMDQDNCPALLENGCTGSLPLTSAPTQQIPVLPDGSLLVPCADNNTWIVDIREKTVKKAVRMHALADGYAVLVGDQVMTLQDESTRASVSGVEDGSASRRIVLAQEAPYNSAASVFGGSGGAYFYQDSVGVRFFTTDGAVHTLIPQEEISVLDHESLDRTNIWGLAVSGSGHAAFYDHSLAAIRLIRPVERTVTFIDQQTGGTIDVRTVRLGDALGVLPAAPAHSGCTFRGWYDGSGRNVTASTRVTADMEVYARYEKASSSLFTFVFDFDHMEFDLETGNVTINVQVLMNAVPFLTIPVTVHIG